MQLLTLFFEYETTLHLAVAWIMVIVGVVVWMTETLGWTAPYGRYSSEKGGNWRWFGPTINARAAWVVQESASFLVPLGLLRFARPACRESWVNLVLLGMFMVKTPRAIISSARPALHSPRVRVR